MSRARTTDAGTGKIAANVAVLDPSGNVLGSASAPLAIGGAIARLTKEFTRPADTSLYAANDIVSDSTIATTIQALAGAARANGGSGYIVGAALSMDQKSQTPRFRVHLFNATGATVSKDNDPAKSKYADIGKRIGSFDLAAMSTAADATNSDVSRVTDFTLRIPYVCAAADTSLYFVLETLDSYTPASAGKYSLTLFVDQN